MGKLSIIPLGAIAAGLMFNNGDGISLKAALIGAIIVGIPIFIFWKLDLPLYGKKD